MENNWLAQYSKNTRRAYIRSYLELANFAGTSLIERITPSQAQAWVDDMKGRGVSGNTIRLRIAAISRWCQAHNVSDITAGIARPEKVRGAGHLDEQEARALVNSIPADTVHGLQDRALILGYLLTGADARAWKWGDFRITGGQVTLGTTAFPIEVWNSIRTYLKAAGRLDEIEIDEPVFTALSDRWLRLPNVQAKIEEIKPWVRTSLSAQEVARRVRKYGAAAGIERDITPRDLRRSAKYLKLSGFSINSPLISAPSHTRPLRRALLLQALPEAQ